jgi:hypothetical protein
LERILPKENTNKKLIELIADGGNILDRMKNITNKLEPSVKIDNSQIVKEENKKDLVKTNILKEQEKKVVANESNRKGKTQSLDMKKKASSVGIKLTNNNSTVKGKTGEDKTKSNNVGKKNNKKKKSKIASSGKSKENDSEENEDINVFLSEKKDNENTDGYKIHVERKTSSISPAENKLLDKNLLNVETLKKSERDLVKGIHYYL